MKVLLIGTIVAVLAAASLSAAENPPWNPGGRTGTPTGAVAIPRPQPPPDTIPSQFCLITHLGCPPGYYPPPAITAPDPVCLHTRSCDESGNPIEEFPEEPVQDF